MKLRENKITGVSGGVTEKLRDVKGIRERAKSITRTGSRDPENRDPL